MMRRVARGCIQLCVVASCCAGLRSSEIGEKRELAESERRKLQVLVAEDWWHAQQIIAVTAYRAASAKIAKTDRTTTPATTIFL
jgi:hypothetical protein